MRREALATSLTVLSLLGAGCIASPEEIETASSELDSPLLESIFAFESPFTSAGDAIVLRTNASPEGGIASFWWEIPAGVIQGDDEDDRWIQFLAAPVLLEEDRASLERWMLMAYLADDGMLALNSLALGAPFTVEGGGLMGRASEDVDRSIEPFLFGIGGKIMPGGRVGFVVSGVASEDVELALVLLPLEKEWDDDEDLPEDTEGFLALTDSHPRVALPVVGTGGKSQLALFYEMGGSFGGMTVTSGPVNVEGGSTDVIAGARRDMVVSTEFASGGYAIAAAGYSGQTAAGTWSALADAHGAVSEGDGTVLPFLGPALDDAFVVAIGEGEAPSATSISVDTSSALGDGVFLIQIDLDTTLKELLGLSALTVENKVGMGEVERHADGTVFPLGDARVKLVGLS